MRESDLPARAARRAGVRGVVPDWRSPGRPLPAGLLILLGALGAAAPGDDPPTFERDIKPLFARRCTVCHNRKKVDEPDVSAGLALDSFAAVAAGTKRRRVIEPGRPDESELYRRLNEPDEDERMPLSDRPLSETQRDLVRRWIRAGAPQGVAAGVAEHSAPAVRPPRRAVRSLDVVLPLDAKRPGGAAGEGPSSSLRLVLKVGPLPAVSALAFRGDGRHLAVGTHGAVVVWDLADGRPCLVLNDVPGPVHALAFSRDGKRLAVGAGLPARSGSVRVYAVPGGTLIHDFEGHDDVVSGVAFRPDGTQLASASFDQTVRLWDLGRGRLDGVFRGHSDFVYDVAYARDGRSLWSVSKDRTVKRIGLKPLKELRTYSGHDDDVLAVAVRPDGARFVTTGNEPQLRWWTPDGEAPALTAAGHSGPVYQLAFSGDGRRLISAAGDRSVRLWDGGSGVFQRTLPGPTDWQYAAALSGDGRRAAAGGWDGLVRLWDADSGRLLATLLQPPPDSPGSAEPRWLAVAPQGSFDASPDLLRLARWQAGGTEVAGDRIVSELHRPEEVVRALRGEPVRSPRAEKSRQ